MRSTSKSTRESEGPFSMYREPCPHTSKVCGLAEQQASRTRFESEHGTFAPDFVIDVEEAESLRSLGYLP